MGASVSMVCMCRAGVHVESMYLVQLRNEVEMNGAPHVVGVDASEVNSACTLHHPTSLLRLHRSETKPDS